MKFLEKFIKSYHNNFVNNNKCIVCNNEINTFHNYLRCNFYDDVKYDFFSTEVRLHLSKGEIIYMSIDKFYFVINYTRVSLVYEKEFDNIFELKDYCIYTYNKYKENLIFF
jgi:hypothetical protein